MAQHLPVQPRAQRVPMMSRSALEDRTRPLGKEPTPIWLGHRMDGRQLEPAGAGSGRARAWFSRLARRVPEA